MFCIKEKIKNLQFDFLPLKDGVVYLSEGNKIINTSVDSQWEIELTEKVRNIQMIGNVLNYSISNKSINVNLINGEEINQLGCSIQKKCKNSDFLLGASKEGNKSYAHLINKNDWSEKWKKEFRFTPINRLSANRFYSTKFRNSQVLICYDLMTFEIMWEFDISGNKGFLDSRKDLQNPLFHSILGEWKGVIWLALSSGKTIGIDIESGLIAEKIEWKDCKFSGFNHEIKNGDYLPFGELIQLDKTKGELLGLREVFFQNSNLDDVNIIRTYKSISNSMNYHNIKASYRNIFYPISGQYIYFCDDRQGKVGVFDRDRLEVVWSHQLEIEKEGITQILEMKYENGFWFVLDRNNTLHILERVA